MQLEHDRQNGKGRTGKAELERQNWKGRTGQAKRDKQNGTDYHSSFWLEVACVGEVPAKSKKPPGLEYILFQ